MHYLCEILKETLQGGGCKTSLKIPAEPSSRWDESAHQFLCCRLVNITSILTLLFILSFWGLWWWLIVVLVIWISSLSGWVRISPSSPRLTLKHRHSQCMRSQESTALSLREDAEGGRFRVGVGLLRRASPYSANVGSTPEVSVVETLKNQYIQYSSPSIVEAWTNDFISIGRSINALQTTRSRWWQP